MRYRKVNVRLEMIVPTRWVGYLEGFNHETYVTLEWHHGQGKWYWEFVKLGFRKESGYLTRFPFYSDIPFKKLKRNLEWVFAEHLLLNGRPKPRLILARPPEIYARSLRTCQEETK